MKDKDRIIHVPIFSDFAKMCRANGFKMEQNKLLSFYKLIYAKDRGMPELNEVLMIGKSITDELGVTQYYGEEFWTNIYCLAIRENFTLDNKKNNRDTRECLKSLLEKIFIADYRDVLVADGDIEEVEQFDRQVASGELLEYVRYYAKNKDKLEEEAVNDDSGSTTDSEHTE